MGSSHTSETLDQDCIDDAVSLEVDLEELDQFPEESTDTCVNPEIIFGQVKPTVNSSETVVSASGIAQSTECVFDCPSAEQTYNFEDSTHILPLSTDLDSPQVQLSPFEQVRNFVIPKRERQSISQPQFNPSHHRKVSCTKHHSVLCKTCKIYSATSPNLSLSNSYLAKDNLKGVQKSTTQYNSVPDEYGRPDSTKSRSDSSESRPEGSLRSPTARSRYPFGEKKLEALCKSCNNCFCFKGFSSHLGVTDTLLSQSASCPSPLQIDCEDILEDSPSVQPLITDLENLLFLDFGTDLAYPPDLPLPNPSEFNFPETEQEIEVDSLQPSVATLGRPSVIPNLLDLDFGNYSPKAITYNQPLPLLPNRYTSTAPQDLTPALFPTEEIQHKHIPKLLDLKLDPPKQFYGFRRFRRRKQGRRKRHYFPV